MQNRAAARTFRITHVPTSEDIDDLKSNIQVCETRPIITGGGGKKIKQVF
jgi:hypothetical protein